MLTIVETVLFGGLLAVMLGIVLPTQRKQKNKPRYRLRMSVVVYISAGAGFELVAIYVSHFQSLAFLGFLCFMIGCGVGVYTAVADARGRQ